MGLVLGLSFRQDAKRAPGDFKPGFLDFGKNFIFNDVPRIQAFKWPPLLPRLRVFLLCQRVFR